MYLSRGGAVSAVARARAGGLAVGDVLPVCAPGVRFVQPGIGGAAGYNKQFPT